MKRDKQDVRGLIYVHLNKSSQYVISSGIEFVDFVQSLNKPLNNLLLIKHKFEDGDFNIHTKFDYVIKDHVTKLADSDVSGYGDFSWIDFKEVEGLNVLTGEEIAEILYLGHIRHHLKLPFYNRLGNRYVYIAHNDGWFNKTYFRYVEDFFGVLGFTLSTRLERLKLEKSIFGIKKKRSYPPVDFQILNSLSNEFSEGAIFSLKDIVVSRAHIEIPMWVLGDFDSMDDLEDEYRLVSKNRCDAALIFEKKSKVWKLSVK